MTLEQILALVTPLVSGVFGITMALAIFVSRIKKLVRLVKKQKLDNDEIAAELQNTRQQLSDLNAKINYLVEEERKHDRKQTRRTDC